jgi:hypothetical protein
MWERKNWETGNTVSYQNQMGQKYTVTNFKYYISNISLKGTEWPGTYKNQRQLPADTPG